MHKRGGTAQVVVPHRSLGMRLKTQPISVSSVSVTCDGVDPLLRFGNFAEHFLKHLPELGTGRFGDCDRILRRAPWRTTYVPKGKKEL